MPGAGFALGPDEVLPDATLEGRARSISAELRCVVCQNQSIDDSDAPLARDLRLLVRDRLRAGDTDGQVREFVSSRYGEFVLLKPTIGWHTALLWLGPLFVFSAAAVGLVAARRGGGGGAEPLSAAEEAEIQALVVGDGGTEPVRPR